MLGGAGATRLCVMLCVSVRGYGGRQCHKRALMKLFKASMHKYKKYSMCFQWKKHACFIMFKISSKPYNGLSRILYVHVS